MLNLLPQQEKDKIRKEYLLRRWSIFLIFLAVSGFISLVFLAPAYAVVYLEKQHLEEDLLKTKTSTDDLVDSEVFEKISNLSEDLDLLLPHTKDVFVIDIIKMLTENRPEELSITSFAVQKNVSEKTFSVSMSGTAVTRGLLLDFSEQLRGKEYVNEVEIPLTSFTQEENLEFSMQLKGEF
ncbi:MAG: hypothetical protein ACQESA_03460 [Patescibacteria group bacterium]